MKTWMLILLLSAGTTLSADIVTSVSCTVSNGYNVPGSTVTDPSSCSLKGPDQGSFGNPAGASATASASFLLADNPNSFSSLSVRQDADTIRGLDSLGTHELDSAARSEVSVNEALYTTGSMRSGFVQISVDGGGAGLWRGRSGTWDLSFGSIAVSCFSLSASYVYANCIFWPNGYHSVPGYGLPVTGQYYPFTLGQAFGLNYSGGAGGSSCSICDGFGYADVQFQFRFFEADGVTPVAVEAVPEPGTFTLFGAALGILAAVKKKLQR